MLSLFLVHESCRVYAEKLFHCWSYHQPRKRQGVNANTVSDKDKDDEEEDDEEEDDEEEEEEKEEEKEGGDTACDDHDHDATGILFRFFCFLFVVNVCFVLCVLCCFIL
jgi:hypothetical protein